MAKTKVTYNINLSDFIENKEVEFDENGLIIIKKAVNLGEKLKGEKFFKDLNNTTVKSLANLRGTFKSDAEFYYKIIENIVNINMNISVKEFEKAIQDNSNYRLIDLINKSFTYFNRLYETVLLSGKAYDEYNAIKEKITNIDTDEIKKNKTEMLLDTLKTTTDKAKRKEILEALSDLEDDLGV